MVTNTDHPMIAKAARKIANRSNHKCHKHGVMIFRGGSIIATGANHDNIHAEVSALNSLWPSERRGTKVVSIRVTRSGKIGMAKPCVNCERYLRDNGVKTVYYSDNNGMMQTMKL